MLTKLTRHGETWGLVIDKPLLDLLQIGPDTELEITTDGTALIVCPVRDPERKAAFEASLEKINRRYGGVLKKLAE